MSEYDNNVEQARNEVQDAWDRKDPGDRYIAAAAAQTYATLALAAAIREGLADVAVATAEK